MIREEWKRDVGEVDGPDTVGGHLDEIGTGRSTVKG